MAPARISNDHRERDRHSSLFLSVISVISVVQVFPNPESSGQARTYRNNQRGASNDARQGRNSPSRLYGRLGAECRRAKYVA